MQHAPLTCRFHTVLEKNISAANLLTPTQIQSTLLGLQALSHPPHAFFLGHGPGVGKTRILAALAKQHLLTNEKADILWLVPNSALKQQAKTEMALFQIEKNACRVASYAQIRLDSDASGGSLLILDEAHLVRNSCSTSDKVNSLQDRFEAVVYSTATAASNVARLSYMKRLELWGDQTAFGTFQEFSKAMKRWGPAASEMLSLDLKQRGLYTCFKLPLVPLKGLVVSPNAVERRVFDEACTLWRDRTSPDKFPFLQRLTTSLKAQILIPRWRADLTEGYSVVIVLQGTGAAASSRGSSMLRRLCDRNGIVPPEILPEDALEVIREGLRPESVAEISGRPVATRQPKNAPEEEVALRIRGNSKELSEFREGRRRILAMTAAGTLGLNVTSPRPIRMYILEFPWTPESLAQQLGRCNRLNSTAPDYFTVSLNTIVEKRVEASLAARSETLGALSCADRTAGAIQSLPWGRKLMKLVTLEMTTRLLAETLSEEALARLKEDVSFNARTFRHEAGLHKLHHGDLLRRNEEERYESLRSILSSDPSLTSWISGGWTPSSHHLFAPVMKSDVATTLLCLNRRGFPTPLSQQVLEYAFGSRWDVNGCLASLPEGMRFLDEKDSTVLLSSGATLELDLQQRLLQSCEENSARMKLKEPRILSVLEYCTGRRTLPTGFHFEVILRPSSEDEMTVVVTAKNAVKSVKRLVLFATCSGHIVHCEADTIQYPGRMCVAQSEKEPVKTRNWLPLDAFLRFRSFESKHDRLRSKAARHMSKSLLLRFRNPLQYWDVSTGQVLSVAGSATYGRFVGLLMETVSLGKDDRSLDDLRTQEEGLA